MAIQTPSVEAVKNQQTVIRTLDFSEIEQVSGGFIPLLYIPAAVGAFGAGYAFGTLVNNLREHLQ